MTFQERNLDTTDWQILSELQAAVLGTCGQLHAHPAELHDAPVELGNMRH